MVKKKCKIDDEGNITCEEPKDKEEKSSEKSKCTTLTDSKSKEEIEVCTKEGKPVSAKRIAGKFGKEED